MNISIMESLLTYYKTVAAFSVIYSPDIKEDLNNSDILDQDWFLKELENLIKWNKTARVFDSNDKDNIFSVLYNFRFERNNFINVEDYNNMIIDLNLSNDEFSEYFLRKLRLSRNLLNEINNNNIYLYDTQPYKQIYSYDKNLIESLLCSREEFDNNIVKFLGNEFYLFSIVGLVENIPEILQDDEILFRLYFIVLLNIKVKDLKRESVKVKRLINKKLKSNH